MANRVVRHWRPLIKNRIYFGLRNGARHHSPWEILGNAAAEIEHMRRDVERSVGAGELTRADLARFEEEALSGFEAGLAAARKPQRKLMRAPARRRRRSSRSRPAFPLEAGFALRWRRRTIRRGRTAASPAMSRSSRAPGPRWATTCMSSPAAAAQPPSLDFEDGVWVHRAEAARGAAAARSRRAARHSPADLGPFARDVRGGRQARRAAAGRSRLRAPLGLRAGRLSARAALSARLRLADDDGLLARFAAGAARRSRVDGRARRAAARARTLDSRTRAAPARQQPRHRRGHRAPLRHGLRRRPSRLRAPRALGLGGRRGRAKPDEALRFLFVGRLESRKGVDTLLAAAPAVLRRFPAARLDIVGDDSIDGGKYKTGFSRPNRPRRRRRPRDLPRPRRGGGFARALSRLRRAGRAVALRVLRARLCRGHDFRQAGDRRTRPAAGRR